MKKVFFTLLALVVAIGASADTESAQLLKKLSDKIKSLGNYHASFAVEAEGNELGGIYVVSGDKYYMKAGDYEVICDGKAQYRVNHIDREVEVDKVNTRDKSIFSNPTRAFEFASEMFGSSYKGEETVGGAVTDVIILVPVGDDDLYSRITLKIERQTGLPVEIRYASKDTYGEAVVDITDLASGTPQGAVFVFDKAKYKGYEIIDFR